MDGQQLFLTSDNLDFNLDACRAREFSSVNYTRGNGSEFSWRLAVGSLFFLSGRGKLFAPERRKQMRQTLIEAHVPFPEFNAVFVSAVEFVLRFAAYPWSADASRMRAPRMRNDHGGYDDRDSKYQSDMSARLGLGILIPSRGALTCDLAVAFPLRPGLVQYRLPDFVSNSLLTSARDWPSRQATILRVHPPTGLCA
jgi:hypothetical protein